MTEKVNRQGIVIVLLLVAVAGAGSAWTLLNRRPRPSLVNDAETWLVQRGDLNILVSEGGTLQAERMERIRSRVPQNATIIYLISEGTTITPEDVTNQKVLVELDATGLKERYTKQEISVNNAEATLIKAREDFKIQEKQNTSDIRGTDLKGKIARMELQQYLGRALAAEASEESDFSKIAGDSRLGGACLKRKTELESNVGLAEEEVQRAKDKAEWTEKLYEKKYVTRNELMADELAVKRKQAELEQAKLALELFLQFEVPKEAETKYADWREKGLELERVKAKANSERAQALSKLKSAESVYTLEKSQLDELGQSIQNCTIRASRPGLVVYASSTNFWRRQSNPIVEGGSVREREEIIHMPDLTSMIAEIKLHESSVKKVKAGQTAVITIDAYPDLRLNAVVTDVATMPDPQNWTQDVNLYTATLKIEGMHENLKPGMACKSEIKVDEFEDILYVPVQSVTSRGGSKVCYVVNESGTSIPQTVEVSAFDDRFVAIAGGLTEGNRVLINPPLFDDKKQPQTEKSTRNSSAKQQDVTGTKSESNESAPALQNKDNKTQASSRT